MKKELQKKLYKKYPKLFRQKDLPMSQTCMCWGITCGNGWYKLIDGLCAGIVRIDAAVEAVQVKEKFGGLRFYTGGIAKKNSDAIWDLIRKAEEESLKTCEICGSKKDISQTRGWVRTLCTKCMEKGRKFYKWQES